jgi:Protein of unknown function (DUF2971)
MRVYYMTSADHAFSNLQHGRLKIAEFEDMNDPFECLAVDLRKGELRQAFFNVKSELAKTRGAICFSRGYSNPVLWSHYADKHRGVCLGFDVPNALVMPMKYDAKRLPEFLPHLLTGDQSAQEQAMNRLLSTKFADWRYENEVRLFASLDERDPKSGHCFVEFGDKLKLKEVLLGPRFDGVYKSRISPTVRVFG